MGRGVNGVGVTAADLAAKAPAASKPTYAARRSRTSGNVTLNSTTWADVDTGLDLPISAAAGNWLAISLSARFLNEAVHCGLDVATIVSAAPVNYVSGSGGGGAAYNGLQGWFGPASQYAMAGPTVLYQVQAGDVAAAAVTLRLRYRTLSAANKTLDADTNNPLLFMAVNHG